MRVAERALSVVFFVLGCGASGPGSSAAASVSAVEVEEPALPGDPVVTLVEPGKEPRAPLRYQYSAGGRTHMFLEMGTTMSLGVGDQPKQTIDTPPIRMGLGIEVLGVDASSGAARLRNTVEGVDVVARPTDAREIVEAMAREMRPLVGMTTEMSMTRRGFARDTKTTIPENASPKLRSMLEDAQNLTQQACATFPKEAVGLGAYWRVEAKVAGRALKLDQTALVTLVERAEDRVVLSYTIEQTAPKQPLEAGDLVPGAEATLESYAGHGNGRSEARLDGHGIRTEMSVHSSFVSRVAAGGQEIPVSAEMLFTMKLFPTAPGAAKRPTGE